MIKKTKMYGNQENYSKMFNAIKNWSNIGVSDAWLTFTEMGTWDAAFYGWSGDNLKYEKETLEKIEVAYTYFKLALAEVLGQTDMLNESDKNRIEEYQIDTDKISYKSKFDE